MITRITHIDEKFESQIKDLGDKFFQESELPGKFNIRSFLNNWAQIIRLGFGALWTFERDGRIVGMLGALISADLCTGDVITQEAFWFVDPDKRGSSAGIRLFEEYCSWSKHVGAKRMLMACVHNGFKEKLHDFYTRKGFRPVDVTYVKEVAT